MALRFLGLVLALAMLITSGCKSSSNYQPSCCRPSVVATAPAPCANPVPVAPIPPPPYPR